MATVEWHQSEDANPVSLPTMVSSSDLFDGELFGDELIDIYNSSVEENVEMQGIPTLDHHTENELDEDHPGARVAEAAAAMDDGLGAFRPSTSFNDLAAFVKLELAVTPAPIIQEPQTVPAPRKPESPETSKKRSVPAGSESPPAKKKATPRARKNSTSKKQSSPSVKKHVIVDDVPSNLIHVLVSPTKVEDAVVTAAVEAAAAAAAVAAVSTGFPSLPELSPPAEVTSGVSLSKREDKPSTSATVSQVEQKQPASDPSPCDSSVSSSTNSDTQFKTIAQQSVSNLINSGSSACASPTSSSNKRDADLDSCDDSCDGGYEKGGKVDTSTAHIKALTGNNWVAACSGSVSGAPPAPPVSAAAAAAAADKNNRVRRQNLTPDERARQNRDRNREHARNTRLRKKAYVEELKRTLTELVAQRDAADLEKRQSAQRELEQREVRFRVIEEFLKLRGRNEPSFNRWAAILEDGFVLTVPSITLYKNTSGGEIDGFEQKLNSVETVMAESTVFASFLQALRREGDGAITLTFNCDRKNFFMDSCNAVLEWTASTVGAKDDLQLKGLMRGKFSPASNKLLSANLSFDTGSVMTQLHSKNVPIRNDEVDVAAAQADAILDSLEINRVHLNVVVPSDVSVSARSSASVSDDSSADHDLVSDKSSVDDVADGLGMATRRTQHRE